MSPTRRYFKKAIAPPEPVEPVERSPVWKQRVIVGLRADGQLRSYDSRWLRKLLGHSKGGKKTQATKRSGQFDSKTGVKAARKRWKKHPIHKRVGIRLGLKKPAPALDYAMLRIQYAYPCSDDWRVRYDLQEKQWYVRDDLHERKVSQRTALRYAGVIKRNSRMDGLAKTFYGIDQAKEGWNRD